MFKIVFGLVRASIFSMILSWGNTMHTPTDELKSKQHNINAYIAHFSYNGEQRAP